MFRPILAVPLLAALAVPVAACSVTWDGDDAAGDAVAAQGSGGSRTYAVRDFDLVALGGVGDVEVRVGGDWSVTATGAPAALDKLLIERDGDTLKLGRKRGMQWGKSEKIRFTVTMPRIEEASIGGAGSITVDRVPVGQLLGQHRRLRPARHPQPRGRQGGIRDRRVGHRPRLRPRPRARGDDRRFGQPSAQAAVDRDRRDHASPVPATSTSPRRAPPTSPSSARATSPSAAARNARPPSSAAAPSAAADLRGEGAWARVGG